MTLGPGEPQRRPRHGIPDDDELYACDRSDHAPALKAAEELDDQYEALLERWGKYTSTRRVILRAGLAVVTLISLVANAAMGVRLYRELQPEATQLFAISQDVLLATPPDSIAKMVPAEPTDSNEVAYYLELEVGMARESWRAFLAEHKVIAPGPQMAVMPDRWTFDTQCQANGKEVKLTGNDTRSVYCQRKLDDQEVAQVLTFPAVTLAKVWDAAALGVKPGYDVRFAMVALVGAQYGHYVQAVMIKAGKWPSPIAAEHRNLMACFAGNWANTVSGTITPRPDAQDMQAAYSVMAQFSSDEGQASDYERGFTLGYKEPRPANCVREFWPDARLK